MPNRILIAEDDESLRRVLEYNLRQEGYVVDVVADGAEAERALERTPPDCLLTDLRMPGRTGLELLLHVRRNLPECEVILLTAHGTVDDAVAAMREGAFDFVLKPVRWEELRLTVARALERQRLRRDASRLRNELKGRFGPERLIGPSEEMESVRDAIRRVAPSPAPVLLIGESGTGKELVARALHYQSPRAAGPFVAINCGALPRELIEAELFGVQKGAFTGADRDRTGRFEEAHRGSLLLDEVTELEPDLQVKLLRVLEDRTVTRLGGSTAVAVDVRVLAATNRRIADALASGRLRQDLYYRLNVIEIEIPPLRARREDLRPLVAHLLEKLGAPRVEVREDAWLSLEAHDWPGNVRELENAIERALLFRKDAEFIAASDLPLHAGAGTDMRGSDAPRDEPGGEAPRVGTGGWNLPREGIDIYALEHQLIDEALERAQGNQTRAAQLLGMTRQTLIYRMQKYGIKR